MSIDRRPTATRRPRRVALGAAVGAALLLAACTATSSPAGSATESTSPAGLSVSSAGLSVAGAGAAVSGARAATSVSTAAPLTPDQPVPKAPSNDLAKSSAHRVLAIDGEKFKLKVDYWTTVESTAWTITGAKDIHLLAYVQPAAGSKPPDVVIDRFSPAFTLLAGSTGLNGVAAGNTVDPDAGGAATDVSGSGVGDLPGFLITPTVSYGSEFSTVGISDALAQRWQQLAPQQAMSEAALHRAGVYAVRVSMTYRLLVRNVGDPGWHRRTVLDTLTVPVKSRT
jgi:hypothetical protein